MTRLRPLRDDDLPALAALRLATFSQSEHTAAAPLAAYLASVLLDPRWHDPELPSLVHEDDTGRITGFIGRLARPMVLRGRPLRAAICTHLMVDPAARGLAGAQLVRRALDGPQDLTLTDVANDAARRLFEGGGGFALPVESLTWHRPLRPLRAALADCGDTRGLALAHLPLRAAAFLLDRMQTRAHGSRFGLAEVPSSLVPLTPDAMAAAWPRMYRPGQVVPRYDPDLLAAVLSHAARKRAHGPVESWGLPGPDGTLVGWFIYARNPRGTAPLLHLAAHPGCEADVVDAAAAHAAATGAVALAGRANRTLLPQLGRGGVRLLRDAGWVLGHARDPGLRETLLRGDLLLSRLDGEWWISA